MTEEEWFKSLQPTPLVSFALTRTSDRKRRLYCAACARSLLHLFPDESREGTISLGEAYADNPSDRQIKKRRGIARSNVRFQKVQRDSNRIWRSWWPFPSVELQLELTRSEFTALTQDIHTAVDAAARAASHPDAVHRWERTGSLGFPAARDLELAELADLWRHLVGNPFRPQPRLPHVPSIVRELGEAVYQQVSGATAPLHDALLDAGLTELAEHFRDYRRWHPKGCWAVDLLTVRK